MNIIEGILKKIVEYKELLIASFGWLFAFVEFIINRNIIRQDKRRERKYQAYSAYMRKTDEVMNNVRNDPNKLLDMNSDFFKQMLNNMGNEKVINEYLIRYNEHIKEFVINATQPLLILRQELNEMKLICSNELLGKIEDFEKLVVEYNNAVQQNLAGTVSKDINSTVTALQILTQDKRWYNFENLNKEILNIMRKEIGN
jgi:HAMP domain-containing protein